MFRGRLDSKTPRSLALFGGDDFALGGSVYLHVLSGRSEALRVLTYCSTSEASSLPSAGWATKRGIASTYKMHLFRCPRGYASLQDSMGFCQADHTNPGQARSSLPNLIVRREEEA